MCFLVVLLNNEKSAKTYFIKDVANNKINESWV